MEEEKHPTSSAFAGDINPLTTIALPTDNAWVEATEDDADMRLIVQALREGTGIQKKDLREKRFFKPWQEKSFEEEGGILFFYEAGRRARIRQLRL